MQLFASIVHDMKIKYLHSVMQKYWLCTLLSAFLSKEEMEITSMVVG